MKFIPSIPGSDYSGSIGGVVASKNHSGGFLRRKSMPINPRSINQLTQRSRVQVISQHWRTLSVDNRNAWSALAKQFPRINSLNKTYYLSGQQMFMFAVLNVFTCDSNLFIPCPSIDKNNVLPFTTWFVNVITTPGSEDIKFNFTPVIPSDFYCVLQSTGMVSAGKSYQQNWKTINVYSSSFNTGSSVKSDYINIFGQMPITNSVVWFSCWIIDSDSGFISTKQIRRSVGTI
jgi:hypothetical protein